MNPSTAFAEDEGHDGGDVGKREQHDENDKYCLQSVGFVLDRFESFRKGSDCRCDFVFGLRYLALEFGF